MIPAIKINKIDDNTSYDSEQFSNSMIPIIRVNNSSPKNRSNSPILEEHQIDRSSSLSQFSQSQIEEESKAKIANEDIYSAVNDLGLTLFRKRGMSKEEAKITREYTSIAIAPICFADLLFMSLTKVQEDLKKQFLKIMKLPTIKNLEVVSLAMNAIALNGHDNQSIRICRIFANNGSPLPSEELQKYGVEIIQGSDFVNKANERIASITNGKINEFISKDTQQALASVFYLKLNWNTPFKSDETGESSFTLLNGKKIYVHMMSTEFPKNRGVYISNNFRFSVLAFPYQCLDKRRFFKLMLMPKRFSNLLSLEKSFNPINFLQKMQEVKTKIRIEMPKTKTSWFKNDLGPVIKEMGFPTNNSKNDAVLMQVETVTNEEGSEVAAVCGVTSKCVEPPCPIFRIDRSFASYIVDVNHKIVLLAEDFVDESSFS